MAHTPESRRKAWAKMQQRRLDWLTTNGPCRICNSLDNLEVHHKDPSQKIHHCVWSWEETRMLAELAKCNPVCARCHQKEIHHRKPFSHGVFGYKRGCRCSVCVDARSEERSANRLRQWGTTSSKPPSNQRVT